MYVYERNPCDKVKFEVYFVIVVVVVDINKIVKPKHKTEELF